MLSEGYLSIMKPKLALETAFLYRKETCKFCGSYQDLPGNKATKKAQRTRTPNIKNIASHSRQTSTKSSRGGGG